MLLGVSLHLFGCEYEKYVQTFYFDNCVGSIDGFFGRIFQSDIEDAKH